MGLKDGIFVCNMNTGVPLHVLPKQNLLFKRESKCYFPNNTYDESKTERVIGSSFAGEFTHKEARLNKRKSKASHQNQHSVQFRTFRGSENEDVDDGSMPGSRGRLQWQACIVIKVSRSAD
jgi:hypothetical protein